MKLFCPQCGNLVELGSNGCDNCAAVFTDPNGWKPVAERPNEPRRTSHLAWFVFSPFLVVLITFGSLCAIECTALPWFTVFAAPIFIVIVWTLLALDYWEKTRSNRGKKENGPREMVKVILTACAFAAMYFAFPYVSRFFTP